MQFGDSTPWLKEHGFAKKRPAELLKDEKFFRQLPNAAFPESDLWNFSRVMKDWGWSAADIAWSATAAAGRGPLLHYVRFRDSTDIGVVKKSLISHGYKEHGDKLVGPSLGSVADPLTAQIVASLGHTVRFYSDKHLMAGSTMDTLPELPDASKSLGAAAGIRAVVAPITTADYVRISAGADACIMPLRASARTLKQLDSIDRFTASATAVVSDSKSTATVAYSSSDAAAKDLPHRKAFVKGLSLRTREPYNRLARFTLKRQDSTIRYTIDAEPRVVTQMLQNQDAPWAMCKQPKKTSSN